MSKHTNVLLGNGTDLWQHINQKVDTGTVYNKAETQTVINEKITFVNPVGVDDGAGCRVSVGGISAGTTINGVSLLPLLQEMFFPYQVPSFTTFTTTNTTTLECGAASPSSITFNWLTVNNSNIAAGGLTLRDMTAESNLLQNIQSTEITKTILTTSIVKNSPGTQQYRMHGTNTQGNLFYSPTITFKWAWKFYYGTDIHSGDIPTSVEVSTLLTEQQVKALTNGWDAHNGTTFDIEIPAGATRIIIAYPNDIRPITKIFSRGVQQFVTENFVEGSMILKGAANSATITYRVYIYQAQAPFIANTANGIADVYEVTI